MPRTPSIRLLVTTLVVAPLLLLAAALVWLSSATSTRIAEDLGQAMVRAAMIEVESNSRRFLNSAVRAGELYTRRVESGVLPADRLREWERPILDDLVTSPDIASICIGTPDGRAVYIQHAHGRMELGRGDGPGDRECSEWVIAATGAIDPDPIRIYQYDPRSRPWYKAGQAAGGATWAPIYTWFGDTGSDAETSTAYVRPVKGPDGREVGTLVVDVTLSGLATFLRSLPIAEQGRLFIIDGAGLAVASSEGAVNSRDGQRLPLDKIDSPAAHAVAEQIGTEAILHDPKALLETRRVTLPDGPARVSVSAFTPHRGIDWRIIVVVPEAVFMADARAAQNRSLLVSGLVAAAGLLLAVAMARGLAGPLEKIAAHVRRVGAGEFDAKLDLRAARELREVSDELNRMGGGLRQRMELEKSLAVATQVQQSLLPQGPPSAGGLDIAGTSTYCDTTGGDYYDFIDVAALPGGGTLIAVGDVMGHGIGSALLMASARAALRAAVARGGNLGQLLSQVNEVLSKDARHGRFMTMILMVIDPAAGTARWTSAGHDPPITYHPAGGTFDEAEASGGIPLGIMEGQEYEESTLRGLAQGDVIILGTDGIWEAPGPEKSRFGKDRLKDVVRASADRPAREIVRTVEDAVTRFRGVHPVEDDVTMVVVRISGTPADARA